ncbi:excinuclease ABC subunit C [Bacterioplanes sanyensis]|uniref:UvrABC system protein C n=1 Tax=Bacterioplanes sanyensis TaxID=1249553 RepID=A0A222FL83_9GAMM|nr:excinuclease ABC subunit UvrC [Bacterioplanes sanyensis]ASP39787.1 excinuclease ABC subunit C [Bacterioplanes sanyensis]
MSQFDIPAFLSTLTRRAGVYRMYDDAAELLYVGKAKNLKNRVSSYFRARGLNAKTVALVARIARIEITVTGSEAEALLLEQTLIKQHRPPFNILLKDDKSYPYLHLSQHPFPRLSYRRGKRRGDGRFFGPYPNSGAVREALNHMQKLFLLRSCEDSYFNHRSRPCLQYEIQRCSGPCVGKISQADYQRDTEHAVLFVQGKSRELMSALQQDMEQASETLQFERAAELRDQIDLVRRIQEKQHVEAEKGDADAWAWADWQGIECLHRLSFRRGRLVNSQNFFPDNPAGLDVSELMAEYLGQFYLGGHAPEGVPRDIIVDIDSELMESVVAALELSQQRRCYHVRGVRGQPRQWLHMAQENARAGAQNQLSAAQAAKQKLLDVQALLKLPETPRRIECFDISHSQGEATFASCVVYDQDGLNKSRYRRFAIKGVAAGDDYAALEQAVRRHLTRLQEQQDCPDLLLIDGGKGQIGRIQTLLDEMGLGTIHAFGISKGETRKSGWEFLWSAGVAQPIVPDAHNDGFRLLQWVRDESHRFAITGHRKARAKSRGQSGIEALPGVGPKRRKALLLHFGSLKNMTGAAREEIARVPGISKKLADQIFAHLHGEAQE